MNGAWGGGKGSTPRALTSTPEEFAKKWDAIFSKNEKDEYQDILSTEDCVLGALDSFDEDE